MFIFCFCFFCFVCFCPIHQGKNTEWSSHPWVLSCTNQRHVCVGSGVSNDWCINSSLKPSWPWWMLLCTEAIMKIPKLDAMKRNIPAWRASSNLQGSNCSGTKSICVGEPGSMSRSLDMKYLRTSIIISLQ